MTAHERSAPAIRRLALRVAAFLVLSIVVLGCSDHGTPQPTSGHDETDVHGNLDTTHAIHIYVGPNRSRIDLPPVAELSTAGNPGAVMSPKSMTGETWPMMSPKAWDWSDQDPDNLVGAVDWKTSAWLLLYGAARECGMPKIAELLHHNGPNLPPWKRYLGVNGFTQAWFIFPSADDPTATTSIKTCSDVIEKQQLLLCMASKLGAVADAIEPIRWDLGATGEPGQSVDILDGPWIIPPQADKDRFIVRDLAIYTLGHLALLDGTPLPLPDSKAWYYEFGQTCSTIWAETAATNANWNLRSTDILFGEWSPVLEADGYVAPVAAFLDPPEPIYEVDAQTGAIIRHRAGLIARRALQIEGQTLRAGASMLYDLIRRSVYSDLAAAEYRSAQTLDPLEANRIVWGEKDRYGSLAHALRVIAGRWQVNLNWAYLPCSPYNVPLDIIEAYGPDRTSRVADLPISSTAQESAAQIVERSGILIPNCTLTALSDEALRRAVTTELITQAQDTAGVADGVGFFDGVQARAIKRMVEKIPAGDLRFAVQRNARTLSMLRNLPVQSDAVCVPFDLQGLGYASTRVTSEASSTAVQILPLTDPSVKGIAAEGGLPRSILPTDVSARAAGIQKAAQCNEFEGWWAASGADPVDWNMDPNVFPTASGFVEEANGKPAHLQHYTAFAGVQLYAWVFQDSFHIGQALMNRLFMLGERSKNLAPASEVDGPSPVDIGRLGAAEIRSWAGPGRMVAWFDGPSGTQWPAPQSRVVIDLMGFAPEDLGANNIEQMAGEISLVYGMPWEAQCAARLRSDCPEAISTHVVPNGIKIVPADTATFGSPHDLLRLVFDDVPPPVAGAHGPDVDWEQVDGGEPGSGFPESERSYYVISSHDPKRLNQGMILGALALERNGTAPMDSVFTIEENWPYVTGLGTLSHSTVFSSMQRELMDMVLGLGKWVGERPPALGDESAAVNGAYCIEGIPRSVFAPLENELTTDSDSVESSWRHYINVARVASTKADELAQRVMDIGLAKDQRAEAAAEELAELCGDPSSLGRLEVDDSGGVHSNPEDTILDTCLAEPKYEVTLMSTKPNGWTPTDELQSIREMLHCEDSDLFRRDPWCDSDLAMNGSSDPDLASELEDVIGYLGLYEDEPEDSADCSSLRAAIASNSTGLDLNSLKKAWTDGWADNVTALAGGMRFFVDEEAQWTLTSYGVPIMSSEGSALWPGCMRNPGGCVGEDRTSTFNLAFRYCPSLDPQTAALGQCGSGSGTSEQGELNLLRWRVMGALWMLAASTDRIPAGMFQMPIPVANTVNAPSGVVNAALYCDGQFYEDGVDTYKLVSSYPEDTRILGEVSPIDSRFTVFPNNASTEVPSWYLSIYQPGSAGYFHRVASNAELTNPNTSADGYLTPEARLFGNFLQGLACSSPFGATASGAYASNGQEWDPYFRSAEIKTLVGEQAWFNPGKNKWQPVDCPLVYGYPRFGNYVGTGTYELTWNVMPDLGLANEGLWNLHPGLFNINCNYDATNGWKDTDHGICPTILEPDRRVRAFANAGFPNGPCGAAAEVLRATALACVAGNDESGLAVGALSPSPPPIADVADLVALENWLSLLAKASESDLRRLYVPKLPRRVVADLKEGSIGSGSQKGLKGQKILDIETELQNLATNWRAIGKHLRRAREAATTARIRISWLDLKEQEAQKELALAHFRAQSEMAQGVASMISAAANLGGSGGNPWLATDAMAKVVSASSSMETGRQTQRALDELSNIQDEIANQELLLALQELRESTSTTWSEVDEAMGGVRSAIANLMRKTSELESLENRAAYQAAKGSGADFVVVDGREVDLPVNTVLRRQYDATRIRYDRALIDAKGLAYLARRAVEQRIGVPMSSIAVRVGPLDAPEQWADDVCRLNGVDYEALRERSATDDGDMQVIDEFADAFIGDYVSKLESFVEYFNMEYPSHEADDTAVLSLKSDILAPRAYCIVESPNLLLYSGQLDMEAQSSASGVDSGWKRHACSAEGKCIRALTGLALQDPVSSPLGVPLQDVTWLVDEAGSAGPDVGQEPAAVVSQVVYLEPGDYLLSWWDQARGPDGEVGTFQDSYSVGVFDKDWNPIAGYAGPAAPSPDWSERRILDVSVDSAGLYHVAFGASVVSGGFGSVAVAGVQLEGGDALGTPASYSSTGATRSVSGTSCPLNDRAFRDLFDHRCESNGNCFYELTAPVVIDTGTLAYGDSSLAGKLAKGNFNYRHISVALNFVGTAVLDCGQDADPGCYGTSYVEYTLEHEAQHTGVLDWNGERRFFDFGVASIQHGKGLAAERYISMPPGSTDHTLLSTPGIERPELRGRPLDGGYRLRIWETPALKWERVEDIQVVLNHRYWSRIKTGL